MRRAQDRKASDRHAARAERIGSAMEVWSSPDLRPLLERSRKDPGRDAPTLRETLGALLGRERPAAGSLRAH